MDVLLTSPRQHEYTAAKAERLAHKSPQTPADPQLRRAEHLARRFGPATCAAAALGAEARGWVGLAGVWHLAALAADQKAVPDA